MATLIRKNRWNATKILKSEKTKNNKQFELEFELDLKKLKKLKKNKQLDYKRKN